MIDIAADWRLTLTMTFAAGFGIGAFINVAFLGIVLVYLLNRIELTLWQIKSDRPQIPLRPPETLED